MNSLGMPAKCKKSSCCLDNICIENLNCTSKEKIL